MNAQELMKLFKYYKGEAENPFVQKDENAALWWGGEELIFKQQEHDPDFWDGIEEMYDEAQKEGECTGLLVDTSVPKEKRIIVFYLDLWHGKWFPYDSWDEIKKY